MKRIETVTYANTMLHAQVGCEFALERLQFFAQQEPAAIKNPCDRLVDFRLELQECGAQVQEGDRRLC